MTKHERLAQLLQMLAERGSLEVDAAADALGVSVATVRRDLDVLAEQQLLNRTHGGAVATGSSFELPLRHRRDDAVAGAKQRIARAAAAMVSRGAILGLNGGTTTTEVARALMQQPAYVARDPWPALTIVTNAVNIATELTVREQFKTVVTGGVARPHSYELTGPFATSVLDEVILDLAFIGVEGLDARLGAAAGHEDEAVVNRLLTERAKRVVVVATADKFGASAFARICLPERIDVILTDRLPDAEHVDGFAALGVEIIVAS